MSRAVFFRLDEDFYTVSDFEQELAGATAAVMTVTEKCAGEIERDGDWNSPSITCILDFVDQAFLAADNFVSATAICDVIARMSKSLYLFFDDNLLVLRDFCFRVVPRLYNIPSADGSKQVDDAMALLRIRKADATQGQAQIIDELQEALSLGDVQNNNNQALTWQQSLSLFASEPDEGRQAISQTLKDVGDTMRIDAPRSIQDYTYSVIEAMVSSKMVFQGYNLMALTLLLVRVGPALDAMSDYAGPSRRLTILLNVPQTNPKSRTLDHQKDIDGLFRALGRKNCSGENLFTGDSEAEDGTGEHANEDVSI